MARCLQRLYAELSDWAKAPVGQLSGHRPSRFSATRSACTTDSDDDSIMPIAIDEADQFDPRMAMSARQHPRLQRSDVDTAARSEFGLNELTASTAGDG